LRGGRGEDIAGFRRTLADALLLAGFREPEVIVLKHLDRHADGAGAAADDIRAGDYFRQVFAYGIANFLVVA
jgi:hypothetical protein